MPGRYTWLPRYLPICLMTLEWVHGQTPAPVQGQNTPDEVEFRDTPATFRTKVNLVLVPVVVREKNGRAVGNLRKEDFQVFDRGKAQVISSFTVETLSGQASESPVPQPPTLNGPETSPAANPAAMPNRFVIYLFDDVHINQTDLMLVRAAAGRYIDESLVATDRAAIFTTSGRTNLDFTDDRAKLHETLDRLMPQPIARPAAQLCPDISLYQADLIQEKNDPMALQAAMQDAVVCMTLDPSNPNTQQTARMMATTTASQVWNAGYQETHVSLTVLRDAVRRLSAMPGQRSIILASPGFLVLTDSFTEETELIDRAIRANVMISALNARGLYTVIPGGDASRAAQSTTGAMMKAQYDNASAQQEEDLLAEVAYGTGGAFFHNSNDLLGGFKRIAARPEFTYVLGFSPQNLKLDGRFHALKITVGGKKVDIQARRGYYAPQHLADPAETAKQEIQDAMFSREELRDIPLQMRTQFFKPSLDAAKLAVLARVDVRVLHFRKENGRNADNLVVASGIFDRNGNLVIGNQKTIEMRLKDQTLQNRLNSGITVRNDFDIKPGTYLIRLVVRDSEGQLMAAANGAVEIPMN